MKAYALKGDNNQASFWDRREKRWRGLWLNSVIVVLVALLCGGLWTIGTSLRDEKELHGGQMAGEIMGGRTEVKNVENSLEIDEIGRFAVEQHNAKEGNKLTFGKVVKAMTQVVSGTMYHLTLEATHEASDKPTLYEARVWTKPWESHKSLEHFKECESSHSLSSDSQEMSGLRQISVEDPVIKEAAEYALRGLNDKSNSLTPYVLKKILSAQAEAGDEVTQFELHMAVSRGTKEEEMESGLHRTAEGKWTVKHSSLV